MSFHYQLSWNKKILKVFMDKLIHQQNIAENNCRPPQSEGDPFNQKVKRITHFLVCSFFFIVKWVSFELQAFGKSRLNRSTQTNRPR